LNVLRKHPDYPNNMWIDFNSKQVDTIVNYINNGFRSEKNITEDLRKTIKYFRIFNELKNNLQSTSIIELSNNHDNNATFNYLLPYNEESNSMPIITHLDVKFSNANHPGNIRSILEDILKILRLEQKKYWLDNVLPYSDKDTHIDKVNQVISSIFSSWDNLILEIKEELLKLMTRVTLKRISLSELIFLGNIKSMKNLREIRQNIRTNVEMESRSDTHL